MSVPPSDEDPNDRGDGAGTTDPDRAAILARRQRFIALALSGLATAACDKPTEQPKEPASQDDVEFDPRACLKVEVEDPPTAEGSTTAVPQPCLEVAAPPEPEPPPEPDPPPGGEGQDGGEQAPPKPCLKIAAPPKEPPPEPKPQPCLRVAKPPPEPKQEPAKPKPCLKIAKPRD